MVVRKTILLVFMIAIMPLTPSAFAAAAEIDDSVEEANRILVLDFYEQVFNRHQVSEGATAAVSEDYRQHNPMVANGRAAFIATFTQVFADNPASSAEIVRSAADGDLVFLHVHSRLSPQDPGHAVVDIFRVAEGRIVEHWDVIQPVPTTSISGNSMFD
jgi:predicted SnoaL-like aldol condensation-catalyzing enzyme